MKEQGVTEDGPEETWKTIPALFGFPVESETAALSRWPWLTWGLALVIAALSVWAFFDLEAAVQIFGFIPAEAGRYGGLTLLTSFFLHGGVLHLVGNLYFLLIFGDTWKITRAQALPVADFCCTVAGDTLHLLCNRLPPCQASARAAGFPG